jgi:hypothetical protein
MSHAPPDESLAAMTEGRVAWLERRMASSPVPVIPVGATCVDLSEYGRQLLGRHHIHLLGGMEFGLRALGHALRWVENHRTVRSGSARRVAASSMSPRANGDDPPSRTAWGASSASRVSVSGAWSEAASLRVLPVDAGEVKRMLAELRGLPLLRGARGARPADLDVLANVITVLGDAAVSLNGALRALEVNPLWVNGDQVEALDVLVITQSAGVDMDRAEADGAAEMELTT